MTYKILDPIALTEKESAMLELRIRQADEELLKSEPDLADGVVLLRPRARPTYERIECNEFTFVFKYDENDPKILHIYSRHLTTPEEAIGVFFGEDPAWDEERKRFFNHSKTHGLYWFWRDEDKKVVMVISCFKLDPDHC